MEAIADPKEIVEEFLKWWEMDVELNIFGENSCEPHHFLRQNHGRGPYDSLPKSQSPLTQKHSHEY